MDGQEAIATVVRVIRNDTLQIRCWCPVMQARCVVYMTPAGVFCDHTAKEHIVDWCELHADAERLRLVTFDHMRDEYGRLIADLADLHSGEGLSDYLVQVGVATPRPHHLTEALHSMLESREVDDDDG